MAMPRPNGTARRQSMRAPNTEFLLGVQRLSRQEIEHGKAVHVRHNLPRQAVEYWVDGMLTGCTETQVGRVSRST